MPQETSNIIQKVMGWRDWEKREVRKLVLQCLMVIGTIAVLLFVQRSYAAGHKASLPAELGQSPYEISLEDGVMHFEAYTAVGHKTFSYASDTYSLLINVRSAEGFSAMFVCRDDPRETSVTFLISVEEFHRLAEWFDIRHVRRSGG